MTTDEFTTLSNKLDSVHIICLETKGIVEGHTNRIEKCETDRDILINLRR